MQSTQPLCPCPICKFCSTCQTGHCKVCHPNEENRFEVLDHKLITSVYDIMDLDIIDWGRLNGSWRKPGQALKTISSWLVNRAHYTITQVNIREAPRRDDFPGWNHIGNHEQMGRWYWNWFHVNHEGTLRFSDAPDFWGTFRDDDSPANFYGDIGRVSAQAFAIQLKKMHRGDIWISVLDSETQVIIEPMTNNAAEMSKLLGIR
jgi:hypothetical protein